MSDDDAKRLEILEPEEGALYSVADPMIPKQRKIHNLFNGASTIPISFYKPFSCGDVELLHAQLEIHGPWILYTLDLLRNTDVCSSFDALTNGMIEARSVSGEYTKVYLSSSLTDSTGWFKKRRMELKADNSLWIYAETEEGVEVIMIIHHDGTRAYLSEASGDEVRDAFKDKLPAE